MRSNWFPLFVVCLPDVSLLRLLSLWKYIISLPMVMLQKWRTHWKNPKQPRSPQNPHRAVESLIYSHQLIHYLSPQLSLCEQHDCCFMDTSYIMSSIFSHAVFLTCTFSDTTHDKRVDNADCVKLLRVCPTEYSIYCQEKLANLRRESSKNKTKYF